MIVTITNKPKFATMGQLETSYGYSITVIYLTSGFFTTGFYCVKVTD